MNLITFCFITPLIIGIIYFVYVNRFNEEWEKGIFPENLPYSRDNLMEAYICLAALMIQKDTRNGREKKAFLNSYFKKHFPESIYNFGDSLSWSYSNPIKPKTAARWIYRHIKDPSKRLQVLYFLVGISIIDGEIIDREYAILKEITPILGLSTNDLDSVVNMYIFSHQEKHRKNSNHQGDNFRYNIDEKKKIASKVLGLEPGASILEIKKSYRKLVKIHHPDRFSNESEEQQNLAHQRFIQIQEAYDFLEKLAS